MHDPKRICEPTADGEPWQAGKTAASVRFVREAEACLAHATDPGEIALLKAAIEETKNGRRVLTDWTPVKDFLRGYSAHDD